MPMNITPQAGYPSAEATSDFPQEQLSPEQKVQIGHHLIEV